MKKVRSFRLSDVELEILEKYSDNPDFESSSHFVRSAIVLFDRFLSSRRDMKFDD